MKGVIRLAIPADYIVSVNPRVIYGGSGQLVMSGLLLTDNPLCTFPQLLSFPSADAVGSYFGVDSKEYALATNYFLGYDNSFRKPEKLYFARRGSIAMGASIIGAEISATYGDFQSIADGSFKISLNGTEQTYTGLDFTKIESLSDVARVIQNAIIVNVPNSTVVYSSVTKGFVITNGSTGATSTISYVTAGKEGTDISAMLGMTENSGAVISTGSDSMTPVQAMTNVIENTKNWVSFTCVDGMTSDEIMGFAQWTSSQGVSFLFSAYVSESAATAQSVRNAIETAQYSGTSVVYGTAEYAVFIMAEAASIDWNRRQGVINFAFKSQSGLAAVVTDGAEASNLEAAGVNYYGRWATRNPEFVFLYNGTVSGKYKWLDAYVNAIWLRSAVQISCMDGLKMAARVPYNDDGYTQISAWLQDPINTAIFNGCIDAGVKLSEKQKAELYIEAGEDISEALFTEGYFYKVEDPGAVVRAERGTPIINLWYTYGGSVNKLNIPLTAFM